MKILITIVAIVCLLSSHSKAQSSGSAKIHILNAMSITNAELKIAVDPKNPIVIKSRTWVIIQPVGDSLSFIVDKKTYLLHFEPNKQYYFVIQVNQFSRPIVTEKSEREFILTATVESAKGPEEYILNKVAN